MSRRSVFAQLALVIALVLAGAAGLAFVLAREAIVRPGAEQMLDAMESFATVAERSVALAPRPLERLRALGLRVATERPGEVRTVSMPLLRVARERAAERLGPRRELRIGRDGGERVFWIRLDRPDPLWIGVPFDRSGRGALRFSLWMLVGCVALVWIAAAVFARRLVQPLRELAQDAPRIAHGEPLAEPSGAAPREVAELAQALSRAGAQVRQAASDRALMLAGISHDLRTPLTRVQFALELLPDTDPDLRAGIGRDIAEIDAILAQFVAYARDGRDEAAEDVDLTALCRAAADAMPDVWRLELPKRAMLRGKPLALRRALDNLVTNAQRHGAAPFGLSLAREGDAWRIEVRDHGPGIAPDAIERMRQPFARGSAGDGGSGLGLAIVERAAREHGGGLELLAGDGRGLRAVLHLRGVR